MVLREGASLVAARGELAEGVRLRLLGEEALRTVQFSLHTVKKFV